ncbi:ATPase [Aliiroseovarius crassostreae]|uniref:ATPase n=1 Tax=Aliiroseovarius crassostreae TaxID=154981 RepID=A0A9Q9HAQ6_9RHOB|nr:ATPase [Aliiroseovarius crassostreae]UWP96669.1 ATPase [Aliiroseovarius crassostreae]
MLYQSSQDWQSATHKRVLFFGMSGLGKTYLSNMLRDHGDWFHYSIDYRIGTRYMGEHIADNFKAEAMKVPFLRELLLSDSIRISSKITFENLKPMATYLGKPGDTAKGGLPYEEYCRRQQQFKQAEISALLDTRRFIDRADRIYGYPHFICDSGGSICEWIDPALGADDPILKALSEDCLLVWLRGDDRHTAELVRRFDKAPKPMAYQPEFLTKAWNEYLSDSNLLESDVDPDSFIRWTYAQALAHRQPLYQHMAQFGVTLCAEDVAQIKSPDDFDRMIGAALDAA